MVSDRDNLIIPNAVASPSTDATHFYARPTPPGGDWGRRTRATAWGLRTFWLVVQKHRSLIVGCSVAIFLLVAIYTLKADKQYEGTVSLAIYKESQEQLINPPVEGPDDWNANIDLDTQVKVIRSETLAWRVIQELRLDEEVAFAGDSARSAEQAVLKSESAEDHKEELIAKFEKNLSVVVLPRTRILELHFLSTDPELAARIANALANDYIDLNYTTKYDATMRVSTWLGKQLQDLQIQIQDAEGKLAKYQAEHDILGIDEKQNVVFDQLSAINNELTKSVVDRIQKQAAYELTNSEHTELITRFVPDTVLDKLRSDSIDAKEQYEQANLQFGPNYPKVKELEHVYQDISSAYNEERRNVLLKIKNDYQAAVDRERMLRKEFDDAKQAANQLNQNAIQYGVMKREVESNRNIYQSLLEHMKEAGVMAGLKSNNIRIIDPAHVPSRPSKPNVLRNLAVGLLLALAAGVAMAFFIEGLDNTVSSPDDIRDLTAFEVLATVPDISSIDTASGTGRFHRLLRRLLLHGNTAPQTNPLGTEPPEQSVALVSSLRPQSVISESYRALRTALLLSGVGRAPRILVVTSTSPREGKTTTSVNTAIVLAQTGAKVLLVDADMRRPTVHRIFSMENGELGLSTLLSGQAKVADVIRPSGIVPTLNVITAGPIPPHPSELLGSSLMKKHIRDWEEEFDYVVLDVPPVLLVTDAVVLSSLANGVILVVRSDVTRKPELRRTEDILSHVHAPILGVVVNAISKQSHNHYYHGYYYGASDTSYYSNEYRAKSDSEDSDKSAEAS